MCLAVLGGSINAPITKLSPKPYQIFTLSKQCKETQIKINKDLGNQNRRLTQNLTDKERRLTVNAKMLALADILIRCLMITHQPIYPWTQSRQIFENEWLWICFDVCNSPTLNPEISENNVWIMWMGKLQRIEISNKWPSVKFHELALEFDREHFLCFQLSRASLTKWNSLMQCNILVLC